MILVVLPGDYDRCLSVIHPQDSMRLAIQIDLTAISDHLFIGDLLTVYLSVTSNVEVTSF